MGIRDAHENFRRRRARALQYLQLAAAETAAGAGRNCSGWRNRIGQRVSCGSLVHFAGLDAREQRVAGHGARFSHDACMVWFGANGMLTTDTGRLFTSSSIGNRTIPAPATIALEKGLRQRRCSLQEGVL
jgi:hypothetical protein